MGTSEAGVRLTGAAMRGNQLRRFGEIATAFRAEHSMSAATRWGHALTRVQLDLPARHMLDLCPSAVSAARWAGGAIAATALLDTETVIDGISTATGGAIPNLETVIKEGARMP